MQTDVQGRVRNVSLPASKPLLPLYEAVVNSIQAIEDAKEPKGQIEIGVIREDNHLFKEQDRGGGDIIGFEIRDNGIGFDDENYKAFETADTTYKATRGGKGIGRFVWLVAFEAVVVDSHYRVGRKMSRRRFRFVAAGNGTQGMEVGASEQKDRLTIVRLDGFKEKYRKQCPKRLDTIGAHITEHCLEYFIRSNCPTITLADRATGETINLNAMFAKDMVANSKSIPFDVGDQRLYMTHVRLYSAHVKDHMVHYCADDRVVKSEKLAGRIPNLTRRLTDPEGREFVYAAYVEGDLLNDSKNSERTGFNIAEDASELLAAEITWASIREAVAEQCRSYLKPYTAPVGERKKARIDRFVATDAPMYRPIMKYIADKVERIDPEVSDNELDLQLYEAYHDLQVELKAEGQVLFQNGAEHGEDLDEFEKRFKAYFDKVTDINAADLARYICHRKAILDFLQKQLGTDAAGKYRREDRVHSIIFPMGRTSDEVPFDGHNLWLIDERLAYHAFLASDKQLRTVQPLDSTSQKEPDIIVFNAYDKACAFAPSGDPPYPSIVIVEFKRPMRNNYDEEENPFVQVREYITDIRDGKAKTPDGRVIPFTKGTPFYCFIVCDITPRLETQALYDFELTKTPDGMGFFGYKKHLDAYVEVISYDKMVMDAKKRNAVFFDKLGLPSRIGQ